MLRAIRLLNLRLFNDEQGSTLLEFAIVVPLLVIFVVGIYDFSLAFNQRQKIVQAAQEGAIVAGAQPMSDIQNTTANPTSLQPVVTAVFNSLVVGAVLPNSGTSCTFLAPTLSGNLTWIYNITNCSSTYSSDKLTITINRGWSTGTGPVSLGTAVTVVYPYHWRFGNIIQLGSSTATISSTATVHNQI
jgi:Flp pilus assembly protein TadG